MTTSFLVAAAARAADAECSPIGRLPADLLALVLEALPPRGRSRFLTVASAWRTAGSMVEVLRCAGMPRRMCGCCLRLVCEDCRHGRRAWRQADLQGARGLTGLTHGASCAGCGEIMCVACYREAVRCGACQHSTADASGLPGCRPVATPAFGRSCRSCDVLAAVAGEDGTSGRRRDARRAFQSHGPGLVVCRQCSAAACGPCANDQAANGGLGFRRCRLCSASHCDRCKREVMGEPGDGCDRRTLCVGCDKSFGCKACARKAQACSVCATRFCTDCARRRGGRLHDCEGDGDAPCDADFRACDTCFERAFSSACGTSSRTAFRRCCLDCARS